MISSDISRKLRSKKRELYNRDKEMRSKRDLLAKKLLKGLPGTMTR